MLILLTNFVSQPLYALFWSVLVLIWLILLSFILVSFLKDYRRIVRGVTASDLRNIWVEYLERLGKAQESIKTLEESVDQIKEDSKGHLQKTSLVRFNPFSDTGGDQSFSIALLDKNGDGIVLSSLHGRAGTRVYAKAVKSYKSYGHELSKEELEAVNHATKI